MTTKNKKLTKSQAKPKTVQAPTAPSTTATAAASTAGSAPTPLVLQAQSAGTTTSLITNVANASNTGTKVALQTSCTALVAGLLANYAPGAVFPLLAGDLTRDEVIAEIQQYIDAAETTKSTYATWRGDVQTERQVEAGVSSIRAGVRSILEAKFGKGSPVLLQYGFQPQKSGERSAISKATAVVKQDATRKARGTSGKKERLKISGNVTSVTFTPVVAPDAPSTPASTPAAPPASTPAPAVKPAGSGS